MTDLIPRLVDTNRRLHLEVIELRLAGNHELAAAFTAAGIAITKLIGVIVTQGEVQP